jgi:hypothetical protein
MPSLDEVPKPDVLQMCQASLLSAQHALLSGNQALLESNQIYHVCRSSFSLLAYRLSPDGPYYFQSILVNTALRGGLFHVDQTNESAIVSEDDTLDKRWHTWARAEVRKRTGKNHLIHFNLNLSMIDENPLFKSLLHPSQRSLLVTAIPRTAAGNDRGCRLRAAVQ